jgi:hypothetical protein
MKTLFLPNPQSRRVHYATTLCTALCEATIRYDTIRYEREGKGREVKPPIVLGAEKTKIDSDPAFILSLLALVWSYRPHLVKGRKLRANYYSLS